jgi:hypothetical protein
MKKLLLFLSVLLCVLISRSQNCTNCGKAPKVACYDLSVNVDKPVGSGDSLLKWKQLFWLSAFAKTRLFELNKNCVRFTQPLVKGSEGKDVILAGETSPMLAENSEPSKYGDYLITGMVVQYEGRGCIMYMELQAACSGKKVASAEVPFELSTDAEYIAGIGRQAASKLSPLGDKIKNFELEQRKKDPKIAFANLVRESLTLKPQKRQLTSNEETEVDITLKDCDGYILANRLIEFNSSSIGGMAINGTTGGTVTPSSVTTDANGKAKVKFKMGTGKTAMIVAHYSFYKPSGCPAAMINSEPINQAPFKVEIEYEYDQTVDFHFAMDAKNDHAAIKIDAGDEHSWFNRYYRASFYYYPPPKRSEEVPPEMIFVIDPHFKDGSTTVYETEYGFFHFIHTKKEGVTAAGTTITGTYGETSEGIHEGNYGRVKPQHTNQFIFSGDTQLDPMYFGLAFDFQNEEEDHPVGTGGFPGSITVRRTDTLVKFTARKITDPKSPYKTEFIFDFDHVPNDPAEADHLLGTNFKEMMDGLGIKNSGREYITVRILSPYEYTPPKK